jgi:hypothetical protein
MARRKEFFLMTELRRTLATPTTAPKLDLDAIKKKKPTNLTSFQDMTLVYLGASDEPKEYFKSKKDSTGATLKDATGKVIKETVASGYVYIFSEYNTSRQVRVVFKNKQIVKDLDFYNVSGKGYKLDGFDYLVEEVEAVKYAR